MFEWIGQNPMYLIPIFYGFMTFTSVGLCFYVVRKRMASNKGENE